MELFVNGKPAPGAAAPAKQDVVVAFARRDEASAALQKLGIDTAPRAEQLENEATRYESRFGFDYINVMVPKFDAPEEKPNRVEVYFTPGAALFIAGETPLYGKLLKRLQDWQGDFPGPTGVLHQFFNLLIAGHADRLEAIEDEIADLEEQIITQKPEDYIAQISVYRRRTLMYKRYYEGLLDLHEDLLENHDGYFDKEELRLFQLQTDRVDRLYREVLNLRDYITQVRESYQNQLDISLNETMKLFTVLSAIFMPLTLIAGWYGMNLAMPEYAMPNAYPVVIGVCVAIVLFLLWYFKKKRWY